MFIMVVDDDEDQRRSMLHLLEEWGHSTQGACDGREAVELAEQHPPEVVLMDLNMPVMNGFEAVHRMRALPTQENTVIIAISGCLNSAEWRVRASDAGFHRCLAKPVDLELLSQELLRVGAEWYCRRLASPIAAHARPALGLEDRRSSSAHLPAQSAGYSAPDATHACDALRLESR
jgi:CheY-like chemotaxis protein